MIPLAEIRAKARELGVPMSTIERDYAQNWLLKHLAGLGIVLKGGTGVRKVYIEGYRFSDDLDFTMLVDEGPGRLEDAIRASVAAAGEESGIDYNHEAIGFRRTGSGIRATVYFPSRGRTGGSPMSIKIDITSHQNERVLLPVQRRKIIHSYSDSDELAASITSYSLEEIYAEKIRALFQRTRPRDLYDVWRLRNRVNRERVADILPEKCESKGVTVDISILHRKRGEHEKAWAASLVHQLDRLPDFDKVYDEVIEIVAERL